MRAYEFIKPILREYKRDITARQYGEKILQRWHKYPVDGFDTLRRIVPDSGKFGEDNMNEWVVNTILTAIERNGDPTPNKIYTPWIAREYSDNHIRRLEDLDSRIKPMLEKYHQYKSKSWFPQHAKDIFKVNINQLSSLLANLQLPQEEPKDRGEYKEFYKDNDIRIIIPEDVKAACYYGQGTQWCTAATRGKNYFSQYTEDGSKLYIIIPSKPNHTGEKYQLHFESNQIMNEKDDPVDIKWLFTERFPQLMNIFKDKVQNYLQLMSDDDIKQLISIVVKLMRNELDNEITSIKDNKDDNWREDVNNIKRLSDDLSMLPSSIKIFREIVKDNDTEYGPATVENINYIMSGLIDEVLGSYDDYNNYDNELSNWVKEHVAAKLTEYVDDTHIPGKKTFTPVYKFKNYTIGLYLN